MNESEVSRLDKLFEVATEAFRLAHIANAKADESAQILAGVQEEATEAWAMADEALGFVERY